MPAASSSAAPHRELLARDGAYAQMWAMQQQESLTNH
jgi:hypothetical protein